MLRLIALVALLLATQLAAQPLPGHFLVLSDGGAGTPRARLYDLDPATGTITDCGRFADDHLRPLAMVVDPINGQVLVASERPLGAGSSVQRHSFGAAGATQSRQVLTTLRTILDLSIGPAGRLVLAMDSGSAGIDSIVLSERNSSSIFVLYGLGVPVGLIDAMSIQKLASHVVLVEQSKTGPLLSMIDLSSGNPVLGPVAIPGQINGSITGVYDMPTGVSRQILSDGSGQLSLFENQTTLSPVPFTPILPTGSTATILGDGLSVFALGDQRHPHLIRAEVFGDSAGSWSSLGGPFSGSPIDFDQVPSPEPELLRFGESCFGGSVAWSGTPRLGNLSFRVELQAAGSNVLAGLAIGLSEQRAGSTPLPLALPGSCSLLVAPDLLMLTTTSPAGYAGFTIPIPGLPALYGQRIYGQWITQPIPLRSSDAFAAYLSW